MNLPNKLTVLRVIMVPFFVFFMLTDVGGAANKWIALVIFAVASLTDMLDGKIARARGLVTNFGKFMDPLADKLLVCSAMICMISTDQWFPSCSGRQWDCYCCKLLGEIQDCFTDVHGHCTDHGSGRRV